MRAALVIFLSLASALAGCSATAQQRLMVSVRAAESDAPAPGVAVKVTTRNPQHALRVSDYTRWLGGGPAKDAPAVLTDTAGHAEVLAPIDRPFVVQFLLPGLQTETIFLRENGAGNLDFQPTEWITLPPPAGDGAAAPARPRWRVRVEASGRSSAASAQ